MDAPRTPPLVYVMTPVYNGGAYLRETLETVVAQTYPHWVCTIVNNRSTDRSADIAREFAARDPRFRVHDNLDFVPAIDNFNIGFALIPDQCTYCKPLMADDWLLPDCLAEMVRLAGAHPNVGLISDFWSKEPHAGDGRPAVDTVFPGREICRDTLRGRVSAFGSPTNLLIRGDLVRRQRPFCNPANFHGDFEACFDLLQTSDFGFTGRILTRVRAHEETITSRFQAFGTHAIAGLFSSVRFGPVYLDPEEAREDLARKLHWYYLWLAKQIGTKPGTAFWDFHRRSLHAMGLPLDEARLAAVVAEEANHWARVARARRDLERELPPDRTLILIDDETWRQDDGAPVRPTIPFLEKDGGYWGRPKDDTTAIQELERLRSSGAGFLAIAWPAFWWLEHYAGFGDHLKSRHRCLARNDDFILFDLGPR